MGVHFQVHFIFDSLLSTVSKCAMNVEKYACEKPSEHACSEVKVGPGRCLVACTMPACKYMPPDPNIWRCVAMPAHTEARIP